MSTQPEALRLAQALNNRQECEDEAAAELRRLHTENERLHQRHHDDNVEYTRVLAQRDALLEALRDLVQLEADGRAEYESAIPHWDAVRAAIKAVEKGK